MNANSFFFLATLIYHGHTFRIDRQAKKANANSPAAVEAQAQQIPMLAQQGAPAPVAAYTEYPSQTQPPAFPQGQPQQGGYPDDKTTATPVSAAPVSAYSEYPAQSQYPQQYQQYPQQTPSPAPAPVPTPAPNQYELAQTHPNQGPYQLPGSQPQQYQGQYQQQPYSPHGTPAPGQVYYPPQQ